MNINVYAKFSEDVNSFDEMISLIRQEQDVVTITIENKRCFRDLEGLKAKCSQGDVILVSSLSSLGANDNDVFEQLGWFVKKRIPLVISEIPSTYEFGVAQPMNQAVLSTLLQSIQAKNKNTISLSFKKSNAGRNKIEFPDDWDDLYEKWERKEISSKEFISLSGLKKATFYNLLTEYKELVEINEKYVDKYKNA